jgi:hypothetical protein
MKPEAIAQGRCTDCGESDDNYSIESRNLVDGEKDGLIVRARCTCGENVTVAIPSTDGAHLVSNGQLSWSSASWNQTDEEAEA